MIMCLSRLRPLRSHIGQPQGHDGSLCRSFIPPDILLLLGDGACAGMCLRSSIPDVDVYYFDIYRISDKLVLLLTGVLKLLDRQRGVSRAA